MPYVFYADFETVAEPCHKSTGNTTITDQHRASGYCWVLVNPEGKIEDLDVFQTDDRSVNVVGRMLKNMLHIGEQLKKKIEQDEKRAYEVASKSLEGHPLPKKGRDKKPECFFCKKIVDFSECVRHHEHSGKFEFKGYAHNICNLNAKQERAKINVFFHNMKGFDGHLIIKAASKDVARKVEAFGGSAEKFSGIVLNGFLNIYDSLNFFACSLDAMTKTLKGKLPLTKGFLNDVFKGKDISLLLRKGVYPYSYIDSFEKYKETTLPAAEMFRDKLSGKDIEETEYKHAQTVWEEFEVKNLKDYTELYCLTDVLLLADCFQAMRDMFYGYFGLDAAHFVSLPALSWECCLKHTKCEFDYITDPTMYAWIEQSKRGGMAVGGDWRQFKANNKYVPDYDETKPTSYIQIEDLVNLYPHCMTMFLPFKDFEWVDDQKIKEMLDDGTMLSFILKTGPEEDIGYMYEVDMEVPEDKHKYFEQLTPAPYKRKTDYEEISDFTAIYTDALDPNRTTLKSERLICDLLPRKNYIVHYQTLQLYLNLGFKLTHVHKALQFKQGPIFREYITFLALKRKEAATDVEKNFFKLAGNVLFGKTCENLRGRCQYKIVRDHDEAIRFNSKPNCSRVIILDSAPGEPELAIVVLKNVSCYLDRPVYIGTTTLDLSKMVYYGFYYNIAKPLWDRPEEGKTLHCLGGDTDSIFMFMETPNVYDDILTQREEFDLSNFPKDHKIWGKYYDKKHEKCLGKMKDEMAGKVVSHFVYLKPKMYIYRYVEIDVKEVIKDKKVVGESWHFNESTHGDKSSIYKDCKKGKGIPKQALKEQCNFDQFTKCIESPVQFHTTSNHIRSVKHELYNMTIKKSSLNGLNYKRFDLPCGKSLPFGHKDIKLYQG